MSTIKKKLMGEQYLRVVIEKLSLDLEVDTEDEIVQARNLWLKDSSNRRKLGE
jgi:hypothetical protein